MAEDVKVSAKCENPDAIVFTVSMTAPLHRWRALVKNLEEGPYTGTSPVWELRTQIRRLIDDAEDTFGGKP